MIKEVSNDPKNDMNSFSFLPNKMLGIVKACCLCRAVLFRPVNPDAFKMQQEVSMTSGKKFIFFKTNVVYFTIPETSGPPRGAV